MNILPSIDLLQDEVVRLHQGQFHRKIAYEHSPTALIASWIQQGVQDIHIVDLNAAKGDPRHTDLIASLLERFHHQVRIQIAGGIRESSDISYLLKLGAQRVVMGSAIIDQPSFVHRMIQKHSSHAITLACDVKQGANDDYHIHSHGWTKNTQRDLYETIEEFFPRYNTPFLITDITKDGTLQGPNFTLYRRLLERFPRLNVIVSGGVKSLQNVHAARALPAWGCILGKALHDGVFSVRDALQCLENEPKEDHTC